MSSSDSGNSNRNYEKLIAFVFSIEAKCILSVLSSQEMMIVRGKTGNFLKRQIRIKPDGTINYLPIG